MNRPAEGEFNKTAMPSIREKTQQSPSVTELSRALQHFTNRKGSVRRFAEYLHDVPREQILFFHGDGGNGKSLLMRHLRVRCARQLDADSWAYLQTLPPDEFRQQFEAAENFVSVPTALLDFADRHERVAFDALLSLRRQLRGEGLRFAVFDYACLLYLRSRNELTPERIRNMFPAEEADFVKETIDVLSHAPVPGLGFAKAVLSVINKRLGERFTLYWQRRGIDETELARLHALDPERELYYALPTLLARDLNTSMQMGQLPGAPPRVALFFDTHEAFWEVEERRRAGDKRYENDQWLRQLLLELDYARGLVVVVAGRETPAWAEAPTDKIPAEFVEEYLVGCLERADAAAYLSSFEIDDLSLQAALLDYAEQEPGQVHPYYLGLCADVVLAARTRDVTLTAAEFKDAPTLADKGATLLARLQRYVTDGIRDAIAPLCACRSFDFALFEYLMRELKLNATQTDFNHLVEFSFVWQAETAGRYRLHDLMRRLAFERNDAQTRRSHELLLAHYDERAQTGDVTALAARAYHRNRLEPEKGIIEWAMAMDAALSFSNYETCRALLSVRDELILPDDFNLGYVSETAGEFYATLSQHELARRNIDNAIAAYDEALRHSPDHVNAYNNRGNSLLRLGQLQADLSEHAAALASYTGAVADYDEALRRTPDFVMAHANRGTALLRVGELQAVLSAYEAAQTSYLAAVAAFDEALRRAPNLAQAHNNRGLALAGLGELQAALSAHEAAQAGYAAAVAAYDEALRHAPDFVAAHINRGSALLRFGELQTALSEYKAAQTSYAAAVMAFDEALRRAPDLVQAHHNRGSALSRLGELQAGLSKHAAAQASYEAAVAAYDEALRHAPDLVMAHNNRGVALMGLGTLQADLSADEKALASYAAAAAAYVDALCRAPDFVMAHNNQGNALWRLGELQARLSDHESAQASYVAAVTAYDEALRHAPDLVIAHANRGNALSSLGYLQAGLSAYEAAQTNYVAAVASCDEALRRAPDLVQTHNSRGRVLVHYAVLLARLDQGVAAYNIFAQATQAFAHSLRVAPNQPDIRALYEQLQALLSPDAPVDEAE